MSIWPVGGRFDMGHKSDGWGLRRGEADDIHAVELERIPRKNLKRSDTCPICNNPFLEGMPLSLHPLDYFRR